MNAKQIEKAKIELLTARMDWLSKRINTLQPILKAHHGDGPKIENRHHVNKMGRELKLAYDEMAKIDDELERRGKLAPMSDALRLAMQEKFGAAAQ